MCIRDRLGDIAIAQRDLPTARDAYKNALDIRERLAAQDPDNADWQHDLSVSHNKLGDIAHAQGDRSDARTAYQNALDIRERLAAQDPNNTEWQRGLAVSYYNIAQLDGEDKQSYWDRAYITLNTLKMADKILPIDKKWLEGLTKNWSGAGQ